MHGLKLYMSKEEIEVIYVWLTEEFKIPDKEQAINSALNFEQEYERLHNHIKWSMQKQDFT